MKKTEKKSRASLEPRLDAAFDYLLDFDRWEEAHSDLMHLLGRIAATFQSGADFSIKGLSAKHRLLLERRLKKFLAVSDLFDPSIFEIDMPEK